MDRTEFFTLQKGERVTDKAAGWKVREIVAVKTYNGRIMAIVFESLKTGGTFRNFCGQQVQNRKYISLHYCDAWRLTRYNTEIWKKV